MAGDVEELGDKQKWKGSLDRKLLGSREVKSWKELVSS